MFDVISVPPLGPKSVELTCPTCKAGIRTTVEEESSNTAYLCCLLLFIVGYVEYKFKKSI